MFAKTVIALTLLVATPFMTEAHEFKAGDLTIGHPWSRATPGGAKVGGGYLTITNKGSAPDRLVSATATGAERIEIHEMAEKDGIMTMRQLPQGVTVDTGKTVSFVPGGYHLMLMGLKAPLKQGDRVKAVLTFEKAGPVEITFNVEGIGSQRTPAGAEDHSGHKM